MGRGQHIPGLSLTPRARGAQPRQTLPETPPTKRGEFLITSERVKDNHIVYTSGECQVRVSEILDKAIIFTNPGLQGGPRVPYAVLDTFKEQLQQMIRSNKPEYQHIGKRGTAWTWKKLPGGDISLTGTGFWSTGNEASLTAPRSLWKVLAQDLRGAHHVQDIQPRDEVTIKEYNPNLNEVLLAPRQAA